MHLVTFDCSVIMRLSAALLGSSIVVDAHLADIVGTQLPKRFQSPAPGRSLEADDIDKYEYEHVPIECEYDPNAWRRLGKDTYLYSAFNNIRDGRTHITVFRDYMHPELADLTISVLGRNVKFQTMLNGDMHRNYPYHSANLIAEESLTQFEFCSNPTSKKGKKHCIQVKTTPFEIYTPGAPIPSPQSTPGMTACIKGYWGGRNGTGEASKLLEWLALHRAQGFRQFIMYEPFIQSWKAKIRFAEVEKAEYLEAPEGRYPTKLRRKFAWLPPDVVAAIRAFEEAANQPEIVAVEGYTKVRIPCHDMPADVVPFVHVHNFAQKLTINDCGLRAGDSPFTYHFDVDEFLFAEAANVRANDLDTSATYEVRDYAPANRLLASVDTPSGFEITPVALHAPELTPAQAWGSVKLSEDALRSNPLILGLDLKPLSPPVPLPERPVEVNIDFNAADLSADVTKANYTSALEEATVAVHQDPSLAPVLRVRTVATHALAAAAVWPIASTDYKTAKCGKNSWAGKIHRDCMLLNREHHRADRMLGAFRRPTRRPPTQPELKAFTEGIKAARRIGERQMYAHAALLNHPAAKGMCFLNVYHILEENLRRVKGTTGEVRMVHEDLETVLQLRQRMTTIGGDRGLYSVSKCGTIFGPADNMGFHAAHRPAWSMGHERDHPDVSLLQTTFPSVFPVTGQFDPYAFGGILLHHYRAGGGGGRGGLGKQEKHFLTHVFDTPYEPDYSAVWHKGAIDEFYLPAMERANKWAEEDCARRSAQGSLMAFTPKWCQPGGLAVYPIHWEVDMTEELPARSFKPEQLPPWITIGEVLRVLAWVFGVVGVLVARPFVAVSPAGKWVKAQSPALFRILFGASKAAEGDRKGSVGVEEEGVALRGGDDAHVRLRKI